MQYLQSVFGPDMFEYFTYEDHQQHTGKYPSIVNKD